MKCQIACDVQGVVTVLMLAVYTGGLMVRVRSPTLGSAFFFPLPLSRFMVLVNM